MKLHWLRAILFLYTTTVVATELSSKDYYDPYDADDKVILWNGLFTKLNTILVETDRISKKLVDIDKRLEDHEGALAKVMEFANTINERHLGFNARLEEHGLQISKMTEVSGSNANVLKDICLQFKERQDDLAGKISRLVESGDTNTKYLKEIRLDSNNRQEDVAIQVAKLAENVNSTLKMLNEGRHMLENQGENIVQLMDAVDFNKKFLNDTRSEYDRRIEEISQKQDDQADVMKCLKPNETTWTTILRRQDGSVDFYRTWADYQKGFGNPPNGEFFIGLNKLHKMTTNDPQELMVVLKDWNNETRYAHYDEFRIGGEDESYTLQVVGNYSGDAGDSLTHHTGAKFSTKDKDNDESSGSCATFHKSAWWFKSCYQSHLNGIYRKEDGSNNAGINWYHFKADSYYSLKYAEMKIRPKST